MIVPEVKALPRLLKFVLNAFVSWTLLPTLATMYIARGLGLWIAGVSQGAVVSTYSVILNAKFLGLPYYVYIVFGLAIIAQIFPSASFIVLMKSPPIAFEGR